MIPYYLALREGRGTGRRTEARRCSYTSCAWAQGRRHPFYWAAFIQSKEWANLDGQR